MYLRNPAEVRWQVTLFRNTVNKEVSLKLMVCLTMREREREREERERERERERETSNLPYTFSTDQTQHSRQPHQLLLNQMNNSL